MKYETKITKSGVGFTSTIGISAKSLTFDRGVACVSFNGKYGLIDKSENVIADFKYEEIEKFSEAGKAFVMTDGKIKQINLSGIESEVKSNWIEMPILFNDGKINIVDMTIGVKDDKTAVTLFGKGLNPLGIPVLGPKGLEMPKTPSVSIFINGKEYTSRNSAVGGLYHIYFFETKEQPDSVIIYLKDSPESKVSISYKKEISP